MYRPEIESNRPFESVFCCLDQPVSYFADSLALLRSVRNRHVEVIERLNLLLDFVKDEALRAEINAEIDHRDGLLKKAVEKPQRKKQ